MWNRKYIHLALKDVHKGVGMAGALTCGVAATPALTLRPEEQTENSNIVSQMFHFLL